VLGLQNEIAATVARRIRVRLDPRAEARLAPLTRRTRRRTTSTARPISRLQQQPARHRAAIDLLEQAVGSSEHSPWRGRCSHGHYTNEAFLGRAVHEEWKRKRSTR
jgi:hypothetical protein